MTSTLNPATVRAGDDDRLRAAQLERLTAQALAELNDAEPPSVRELDRAAARERVRQNRERRERTRNRRAVTLGPAPATGVVWGAVKVSFCLAVLLGLTPSVVAEAREIGEALSSAPATAAEAQP